VNANTADRQPESASPESAYRVGPSSVVQWVLSGGPYIA
jgi:hypothetical protein